MSYQLFTIHGVQKYTTGEEQNKFMRSLDSDLFEDERF